jgi:CRISPR type III-B/RAMP module RAMP protein Cmr1
MSSETRARNYKLEALTDLWTGDVNGKPDRLITTGLLGSIRWWFEVLVRGLGGSACDPTDTKCEGRNHCVVCELFGCTGWARKFRFEVLVENGGIKTDQIKQNQAFSLRFTPLRPILVEEWALLDATLRLIAEYGAIGGKTVLKPTDELAVANVALSEINESLKVNNKTVGSPLKQHNQIIKVGGQRVNSVQELENQLQGKEVGSPLTITVKRNSSETQIDGWVGKKHHQDYGLVEMVTSRQFAETRRDDMEKYLSKWRKLDHGGFAWASLQHFWCVNGKYLGRVDNNKNTFNQVLGRQKAKNQGQKLASRNDGIVKWLAGSQQESKKVFSFKNPARTFGFVKPGLIDFDAMKQRLTNAWGQNGWDLLTGEEIIGKLFAGKEDRS